MLICKSLYLRLESSVFRKKLFDRYSDAFQSKSSLNMPYESPTNMMTSSFRNFGDFLFGKPCCMKQKQEEVNDDSYLGSVPSSSVSAMPMARKKNQDTAYDTHSDSIYSTTSVVSDSATNLDSSYYIRDFPHLSTRNECESIQEEPDVYYEKFHQNFEADHDHRHNRK